MSRLACVMAVVTVTACSSRSVITPAGKSATMPDPGGCYVLVYDGPQLMGTHEFINGPRKYATLTNLPFGVNWRNRIRSIETGPRASVTIWADAVFEGTSQTFGPGTKHPALSDTLSGRVESMDVACVTSQ